MRARAHVRELGQGRCHDADEVPGSTFRSSGKPGSEAHETEDDQGTRRTKRDRRIHRDEEQKLLAACVTMNSAAHKFAGPAMHDRIIGALETCGRQGERPPGNRSCWSPTGTKRSA